MTGPNYNNINNPAAAAYWTHQLSAASAAGNSNRQFAENEQGAVASDSTSGADQATKSSQGKETAFFNRADSSYVNKPSDSSFRLGFGGPTERDPVLHTEFRIVSNPPPPKELVNKLKELKIANYNQASQKAIKIKNPKNLLPFNSPPPKAKEVTNHLVEAEVANAEWELKQKKKDEDWRKKAERNTLGFLSKMEQFIARIENITTFTPTTQAV
ncbi:MAG: hypothetical protein QNJ31_01240 [Candidatus Caenarcaniphilales bacterium]|nr:hypothetical protein [Candidatus Caenarcaniphilales bacterium]